jgi:NADH-quinone oxidoreductase subunit J
MVLWVFVVAYVGGTQKARRPKDAPGMRGLALVFAGALAGELFFAVIGTALKAMNTGGAKVGAGFGTPAQIGELLLTRFLVPFEAATILLLISAVGAVVLAKRRGGIHDEEQRISVRDLLRPAGTGTMAEGVSGITGTPVSEPGRVEDAPSRPERERALPGGGGW